MSADSIDLDGLERKDRAELATIAQALGGKPTSRAKKADIISMILDLAGVTDAGDAPESGATAPTADDGHAAVAADGDPADGATAADADGAAASDAAADDAAADDAGADSGPTGATRAGRGGASGAPAGPSPAPAAARGGRSDGGRNAGRRGGAASDTNAEEGPSSRPTDQDRGRDQDDADHGAEGNGRGEQSQGDRGGEQSQGDGQGGDGQPGEGEGRRRRRRRGRDRDRTEDGGDGAAQWEGDLIEVAGVLDLRDEGYGFLRVNGLLPSRDDVYVSVKQTRQFGLRRGDWLTGASRPANRGEKNPALLRIDTVNGLDPERSRDRVSFEDLTPLFPTEQLRLEREDHPYDMASRIIDLIAPIGKGQRGLIVSPPKAGKTTIMKTIAQAIEENHPEVELMVLLVDERPEEVTDMRRSISGEVVASTFDRPPEEHTQVAELAIERAKRMVEQGSDVVVILDGITRLARAYNLAAPNGGRIMSGGLDTGALYPPKRFFGAARNVEEGGSLTILATALVETNSKMDEVIFEEFKGTGNMELRLDRRAAEQRVYPAIDVDASSTRHEELLIDPDRLQQVWKLRRLLSALAANGEPAAGLELVVDRMRKFPTNQVFLAEIAKGPAVQ
ncbi:MAG: transcription termination factor Rho [Microthrixaceae bacterium]